MAVMDAARAFGMGFWTDTEKNLDGLLPVGAVGLCIEQAHVEFDVLAVVLSERQTRGSFVKVVNHRHKKTRGVLQ